MRLAVLQSNYIPWKGYFDLMAMADLFIVYDSVHYTKNDWRNRNILPTPSGPTWLTIPVVTAGRSDQRIHDAVIGDRRWARKHWQTVSQLLARRPSFASYRDVWESWWQEAESFELLHDVNVHFLRGLAGQLGAATPIVDDRHYRLAEDTPTGKLVQLCQAVRADRYATGPSGVNYLDLHRFDVAGIAVDVIDYSAYPTYPQTTSEFEHGVSVIDLLASEGASARDHLLGRFHTVSAIDE
jgi:hypothetical protein